MKFITILFILLAYGCTDDERDSISDKELHELIIEKELRANMEASCKKELGLNVDTLLISISHRRNIILLSDGRFKYSEGSNPCFGRLSTKYIVGKYKMDSIKLTLTPESTRDSFITNTSSTEVYFTYRVDSLKTTTEISLEKWSNLNLEYPLSANLHSEFYNIGWSLEKENDFKLYMDILGKDLNPETSEIYISKIDVDKRNDSILDISKIPRDWLRYLLRTPITYELDYLKFFPEQNVEEYRR